MKRIRLLVSISLLMLPAFACRDARTPDGVKALAAEGRGMKGDGATALAVSTAAFSPGGAIPKSYACDGADRSPEVSWSPAPAGVQSFVVIADDPDAPRGTFTHWLVWNVPAQSRGLPKDVPKDETLRDGARQGRNDFWHIGYDGPCPPPGKPHRYFFRLFALDAKLDLGAGANRDALDRAKKGHVLARGEVMGTYGR